MARKRRRARTSPSICVYCHGDATTVDHVIGEGFFPRAPAGGYIKVPACYPCNNGHSLDEDYLLVLLLGEGTVRNKSANLVLDQLAAKHASGERPRTGLALTLLSKVRGVDIRSPAGIYLGTASANPLDTARANRVLQKIVRGLYFHRFGTLLSVDARLYVEFKPEDSMWNSPPILSARQQPETALDDVFSYRVVVVPENPVCTAWVMTFYGTTIAIALTGPPPSAT